MAAGVAAVRGSNLQIVVVIDVALRTSRDFTGRGHLVRVGQRKSGGTVIKGRIGPVRGVVASGALRHGEACGDVIRDTATEGLRAVPLCQVAAGIAAVGRRYLQGVIIVDVALGAGRRDVRARQGESRDA